METLSSPRDSRFIAFAPLIAIVLLYVLCAAALIGNWVQHSNPANEVVFVSPVIEVQA